MAFTALSHSYVHYQSRPLLIYMLMRKWEKISIKMSVYYSKIYKDCKKSDENAINIPSTLNLLYLASYMLYLISY